MNPNPREAPSKNGGDGKSLGDLSRADTNAITRGESETEVKQSLGMSPASKEVKKSFFHTDNAPPIASVSQRYCNLF
jgi:hypothetical protein